MNKKFIQDLFVYDNLSSLINKIHSFETFIFISSTLIIMFVNISNFN